jgi:hypothetical protein
LLEEVEGLGGKILMTSLLHEDEVRLQAALSTAKSAAVNYGGIGAIHLMGQRLGLAEEIDGRKILLSPNVIPEIPLCRKREGRSRIDSEGQSVHH